MLKLNTNYWNAINFLKGEIKLYLELSQAKNRASPDLMFALDFLKTFGEFDLPIFQDHGFGHNLRLLSFSVLTRASRSLIVLVPHLQIFDVVFAHVFVDGRTQDGGSSFWWSSTTLLTRWTTAAGWTGVIRENATLTRSLHWCGRWCRQQCIQILQLERVAGCTFAICNFGNVWHFDYFWYFWYLHW